MAKSVMTVGEAALELGVLEYRVRRLYREQLIPEPPRVGNTRMVRRADLPRIRAAILRRWPGLFQREAVGA